MAKNHDRPPKRVGEPVQVFLAPPDRNRLVELAERLGASKSDVLRQGLAALERELLNPAANPLLQLIGAIKDDSGISEDGRDLAREHDAFLAGEQETEVKRGARRKHRTS